MPRKRKKVEYSLNDIEGAIASLRRQVPVFYLPARELFSSNTQLAPGRTKTGKPYLYLSEDAKNYKRWIKAVLDGSYRDKKEEVRELLKGGVEEAIFVFAVREGRDTTNMVKTVEDALSEWLGVDDRLWSRVSLIRVPSGYEHEGVIVIFVTRGQDGL